MLIALQTQYDKDIDTPRKTHDPLPDSDYQSSGKTPFTKHQLESLKRTVDVCYRSAQRAMKLRAHERQWGRIMTDIVGEARRWLKEGDVELFNV